MVFSLEDDEISVTVPNKKMKKSDAVGLDFEFSRKSAADLDLGFKTTIGENDPIAVGQKRAQNVFLGERGRGRPRKKIRKFKSNVIRKGVKTIRKSSKEVKF